MIIGQFFGFLIFSRKMKNSIVIKKIYIYFMCSTCFFFIYQKKFFNRLKCKKPILHALPIIFHQLEGNRFFPKPFYWISCIFLLFIASKNLMYIFSPKFICILDIICLDEWTVTRYFGYYSPYLWLRCNFF